jgi:hypothetical protein
LENRDSVDQKRKTVRQHMTDHESLLRQQGTVVESWRWHKGRRLGPYYRLTYRLEGRQRSVYLGSDPQFAQEVREALQELQSSLRQQRRFQQQRKALRRELARRRAVWNHELLGIGLYLKGSEIRGWRVRPQSAGSSPHHATCQETFQEEIE